MARIDDAAVNVARIDVAAVDAAHINVADVDVARIDEFLSLRLFIMYLLHF